MVPSSARRAGETSLTMIVVVVAVLLMAAALATILALVQYLNAMQRPPALADFFPIERNESGEYRFTRPQSFILVPPAPDAGGVLSLRTRSPEPLPVRTLAIRLDERVQFTLAATAVPRRLMLLLPPSSSGRLLTLDVPPAQAPNDLRRLGVMIDSVTLRLLQQPWMWHAGLMVLAPVVGCAILAATRCGWITMACGTLVIAGSALWGPVVPWMLVTVLGAARNYILARIPPGAPVAASNALQPHLTHRSQAFAFPNPFVRINYVNPDGAPLPPRVDYIVHDTYGMGASGANRDQELLRELERRGLYAIVVRIGTVVLLQRTNASLPESCFGEGWRAAICHAPK